MLRFRLLALIGLVSASLLVACGEPAAFDGESNPPPSRAELVARFHSAVDSETLSAFRFRTVGDVTGGVDSGRIEVDGAVTLEPRAFQGRYVISDFVSESDEPQIEEMIVTDEGFWTSQDGEWRRESDEISDYLGDFLLDAMLDMGSQLSPVESGPEPIDLVEAAEIIGVEEVNGVRTTHVRIETDQILAIMMAAYAAASDGSSNEACDQFDESPFDDESDLDDDAMDALIDCISQSLAGELPPPDEYIQRYDVDLWIADDGLLMREEATVEYSSFPAPFASEMEEAEPFAMHTIFELRDLNADDIVIEPPAID